MTTRANTIKTILIVFGFVIAVIGSGSYGYHLADERIAGFIQKTAIENSIFHYKKVSEIILSIEQENRDIALTKLEALKQSELVLFDSCLKYECPRYLREKIESTIKP